MNESLAAEVENCRFTPVRLRAGYDTGEVDDFLDDLCRRLRAGEPVAAFVAGARFTPVRMREGYDMGEVDRLLERVVAGAADATSTASPTVGPTVSPTAPAPAATPQEWINPVSEVTSPLARLFRRRRD
ncbi:DivIVA domain-containing protein [Nocardioides sp. BP30]|uniref:DivIVA domain-containing protein n=1 Tax=Nocardioides sp. BP30 TaxID=3036374 RepID=UPI0024693E0D|nr:DivIVA domain-containing protein [Nocardioides sp. BP30]WGL53439.1 DivIVA domain-containing protein [Nocardioides sp. BP30]